MGNPAYPNKRDHGRVVRQCVKTIGRDRNNPVRRRGINALRLCFLHQRRPQVLSPCFWWIGSRMNRSGSDVQILQMHLWGVSPFSAFSLRAKL